MAAIPEIKEPEQGVQKQYNFPKLPADSGGASLLDDNGVFWIGVNLKTVDAFEACAILDSMKLQIVQMFKKAAAARIVKPGIGGMMQNLASKFKR